MSVEPLPPPAGARPAPDRVQSARRPRVRPDLRAGRGIARPRPDAALFVLRRRRYSARRRRDRAPGVAGVLRVVLGGLLGSSLLGFLLLLTGVGGAAWAAWTYVTADLPAVSSLHVPDFQSTKIYDRHGTLLYEITDPLLGRRTYLGVDQLPPDLINATIAAEDASFRVNDGVDLRSLLRAVYINASGQGTSGASTITMQLVRRLMLPEQDAPTLRRKAREAILANRLSQAYSKDKILEIYVNSIYYGSQAYGVAAAAQIYYGVAAKDLDLAQAALLAGLPQAPSYYDPHTNYREAKVRQEYVLNQMLKAGFITAPQAALAAQENVRPLPLPSGAGPTQAPHFVNYVHALLDDMYGPDLVNRGGLRVITTVDLRYQGLAQRVAAAQVDALQADRASNAALVAINPRNGEILAMLGSVDYNNPDYGQVNVAVAPRQPGSAFKPFTYVTAFKKGYTAASPLADIPTQFDSGPGRPPYAPKDYDLQYRGPVLVREALANSLNIPAVQMLQQVGIPSVLDTAHQMGITTLNDDPSQYGLSLTLGNGEVKLLDLTSAYGTFAAAGQHIPPVALLDVRDGKGNQLYHYDPDQAKGTPAITPQQAYLITDILSDNAARTSLFGANSALKLSRPAAAKTGTTEDYRDSWIVGYTPALVVGVWVGNNDGRPMAAVAGARGAGPIWHNFLEGVFANPDLESILPAPGETSAPVDFAQPPGMERLQVSALSGLLPSPADTRLTSELFIAGTAPQKQDDFYKVYKICTMHSPPELANADCPPEYVIDRPYLVLPPAFKTWEATLGQPLGPPTAVCCFPTPVPVATEVPAVGETPVPGLAPPITIPYPTAQPAPPPGDFPGATIGISAPLPGTAVDGQVAILGSADAADFASYRLDYAGGTGPANWIAIDGQMTTPVRGQVLGVWDTSALPEGRYTLRLTLVGQAGESRQYTVPVGVERSAPQVRISAPAGGTQFTAGDSVAISAEAHGGQGLAGVEFYVDSVRQAVAYSAPYGFTWVATPGTHLLEAVAYSPYGHRTASADVPIAVVNPPTPTPAPLPAFAIVAPPDGANVAAGALSLAAAAGPGAGIVRVDFYVDGWVVAAVAGQDAFQANWQTIAGRHTIMAIGYNAAGAEVARAQTGVYTVPDLPNTPNP